MFCERCGTQLEASQKFCGSCGKPVGMAIVPPDQRRVARHVKLLGVLWIARGALRLLSAGAVFLAGKVILPRILTGLPAMDFLPPMLNSIGAVMVLGAALSFAAGIGLLQRESWGRILAIVMGFLVLLSFPLGTALGIYTLWVLLPAGSDEEYERLARAA